MAWTSKKSCPIMSSRTRQPTSTASGLSHTLSVTDYERLSDFRFALRQFLEFSEAAARGAGLTPQQHQALLAIKGAQMRGGMSVGDLSRRLLLRHHSGVELVDRLVAAGLVERTSAPLDARKVMLELTVKAQDTLSRLSTMHLEELRRVGPALNELISQFSQS